MIELVFWALALLVVYTYVGYAVVLYVVTRYGQQPVQRADITPPVSLIITVRNEEARIPQKLENTLALDYPPDRFEVIVASDCSTDGTHAIVERVAPSGVRLVVAPERRGKEFAQKTAIAAATGEITCSRTWRRGSIATGFGPSSATSRTRRSGASAARTDWSTPTAGSAAKAPTSATRCSSAASSRARGRWSASAGRSSPPAASLCEPWPTDLPSDFTTLLNALRRGYRGVSDSASIGYYTNLSDESREYARKVRTIVRGMAALMSHLDLLNPFRYGLAAWQLFSHKLCRWLVPFALIGMFAASLWLARDSWVYTAIAAGQALVYGLAAIASRRLGSLSGIPRLLTFFVLVNTSILHAGTIWRGDVRVRLWEPSKR